MNIFQILTPLTYWLLVAMWAYILFFLMRRLKLWRFERSLINTLIIILTIDAFRTLFESIYFGARFTSLSGFLPIGIHDFLIRSEMVVIPKFLNVITAALIIGILLYRWFPAEKRDRELLESTIKEHTNQLKKRNERLRYEINERKQAEEALREANDIINRSPSVAFLWENAEGWPVEFVSNNVKELFGYTAEEFTSGKVSYVETVHPDDRERVAEEVSTYSKEEERKRFFHEPYRIITKKGKTIWLDDWTSVRRDKKGNITHYEGIVIDITDRKQAEEELKKHREHLEELVKERTSELEEKNAELERMNDVFVGREFRIKELKKEIKRLKG